MVVEVIDDENQSKCKSLHVHDSVCNEMVQQ